MKTEIRHLNVKDIVSGDMDKNIIAEATIAKT
jgi:hypothetical protein